MTRTPIDRYPGISELVKQHRLIPLPLRIAALHGGRNLSGDLTSPDQAVVERLKGPQPIAGIRSAVAPPRKSGQLDKDQADRKENSAEAPCDGSG